MTTSPSTRRRSLILLAIITLILLVIGLPLYLRNAAINRVLTNYEQRGGIIRRQPVFFFSRLTYWIRNEYGQRRHNEWFANENWKEELQNIGEAVSLKHAPLKPDEFWILAQHPIHELNLPDTPLSPELIAALEKRTFGLLLNLPDSQATDESLSSFCNALSHYRYPIGLELGRTTITNDGVKALQRIPNLRIIGLESPHIDGTALKYLTSIPITYLKLPGCNITDQDIPTLIRDFPGLSFLDLSRTKLTTKGLTQLASLTSLHTLHLDDLPVTDAILALFANSRVSEFSLARTQITDKGLAMLGQKQPVPRLNLSGTRITKTGLQLFVHLSNHYQSYQLTLADTNLDDDSFEILYKIPRLTELDLSGSKITDRFLDRLNSSGLESLRTLIIKRTNTTQKLIPALKKAHPKLRIITDHGIY